MVKTIAVAHQFEVKEAMLVTVCLHVMPQGLCIRIRMVQLWLDT